MQAAIVNADDLADIRAQLVQIQAALERATIKPADEWISPADLAEREGVTRATVRRWVREGKIETKDVGGRTKVRA